MRLFRDEVEAILEEIDNGVWRVRDLYTLGPIRWKAGFQVIARWTGCCVNYWLVLER